MFNEQPMIPGLELSDLILLPSEDKLIQLDKRVSKLEMDFALLQIMLGSPYQTQQDEHWGEYEWNIE